ncbi:BatD family protein [Thalassotalea sp. Y01]|uniref:BatD family protein n=1 Tax=Thalassotalea sp. Y01 TaxID=2729613 RepID=UPI00145F2326|nr:BatD family protein [Thalassotalea sp. Y01]NMP15331.1 protein BatD [Thalassotalea sp. Y01]
MNNWSQILVSLFLCICCSQTMAASIEELLQQEKLFVTATLKNKQPIIAKQAVTILIEYQTDRWFASGNSIEDFEMSGIVKLSLDSQATNSSVRKNGQTYASQIREITLFPMEAGIYELPPIIVNVAVNSEQGVVKGQVTTKPIEFEVILPEALNGIDEYVVSDNFELQVSGEFEQDKVYKIGEAVTQRYQFKAAGVPAMMLPKAKTISLTGLGVYRNKPVLNDENNRNILTGFRTEQVNFIFEEKGQYTVPEQVFYWWNLSTNRLETQVIKAQSWSVSEEVVAGHRSQIKSLKHTLMDVNLMTLVTGFFLALIVLSILYWLYVRRHWLQRAYQRITKLGYRQRKALFLTAVTEQNFTLACEMLYQIVNSHTDFRQQSVKSAPLSVTLAAISNAKNLDKLASCTADKEANVVLRAHFRQYNNEHALQTVEKLLANGFARSSQVSSVQERRPPHKQHTISISDAKHLLSLIDNHNKLKLSAKPSAPININPC